jgi:two-component sensor histidine kinase
VARRRNLPAKGALRVGSFAAIDRGSCARPGGARVLVLQWTEARALAAEKPARKGFGTTLIELELKQISGNAKFGYKDSGFEATLSIPLDPKLMSLGPEPGRPD